MSALAIRPKVMALAAFEIPCENMSNEIQINYDGCRRIVRQQNILGIRAIESGKVAALPGYEIEQV